MVNYDCPNYGCKDCKHFKPAHLGGCVKRVDHKQVEFAAAWFKSSKEEFGIPCCEFEPSPIHVWDIINYWANWESWWQDYIDTWLNGKNPIGKKLVYFTINGDTSIRYGIPIEDYIYGNMYNGNKLKAVEKMYYKTTRQGFGYQLVREEIDSVELQSVKN